MHISTITIHGINVWAMTRVAAAVGLLNWAVFGLFYSLSQYVNSDGRGWEYGNEGRIWLVYGVGLIVSPILAGISAAISGGIMNVALDWVGGLELRVTSTGSTRE